MEDEHRKLLKAALPLIAHKVECAALLFDHSTQRSFKCDCGADSVIEGIKKELK